MDLYSDWARLMIYGDFEPKERRWAVGTAYLRGQGSGRVRAVHGIDSLPEQVQNMIMESRLPQPGQISSSSYEGDGTVIVRHPDTPVVMEALRRLVTDVLVELEPT